MGRFRVVCYGRGCCCYNAVRSLLQTEVTESNTEIGTMINIDGVSRCSMSFLLHVLASMTI